MVLHRLKKKFAETIYDVGCVIPVIMYFC